MTTVVVNPGVCGMSTIIKVINNGKLQVKVDITSDCEMVTKMGEALSELDLGDALKPPMHSKVYRCASEFHLHCSCPVPMAALKAIEVEAGLALPRPVLIKFETT